MSRRDGWRFLDLGRRVERAIALCRDARRVAAGAETGDDADLALDPADGGPALRLRRYAGVSRRLFLDLLLTDEADPRAVAFQIARIREHLAALPTGAPTIRGIPADDLVAAIAARHAETSPDRLAVGRIDATESDLLALSDAVARRWFTAVAPAADPADDAPIAVAAAAGE
jgi:uncharacterized alpha-E superfamily protein